MYELLLFEIFLVFRADSFSNFDRNVGTSDSIIRRVRKPTTFLKRKFRVADAHGISCLSSKKSCQTKEHCRLVNCL